MRKGGPGQDRAVGDEEGGGNPGTPVPSGLGLPRGCVSPHLPPPRPLSSPGAARGVAEEDANSPFPHQLPLSRSGGDL